MVNQFSGALGALSRQMSIAQRFRLIALAALAPLAIACALLWLDAHADRERLRAEAAGIAEARAIWRVAHAAAQTGIVDDARLAVLADSARGELAGEIAALASFARANGADDEIARRAQALLKQVGDRSGLRAEAAAAQHQHVTLLLIDLPELATAIAEANAILLARDAQPNAGLSFARARFALLHAAAAAEDAVAKTADPSAQARLRAGLEALLRSAGDHDQVAREWFRQRQRSIVDGSAPPPGEAGAVLLVHARALQAAEALSVAAAQDLARTLAVREEARAGAAAAALVALLLATAFLSSLIWILSRSVLRPWGRLMVAARAIGAGDATVGVPCQDYANEVGEAARALELFRAAMAERARLTSDLARERDALEARVAARTSELEAARATALESEELLSQALRSVRAGAWSYDPAQGGIWSSRQVTEICGKPLQISDFRDGISDLVTEPQASRLRTGAKDPATGLRGIGVDLRICRPDGAIRWVHNTAVTLPDGRTVGLLMDVSARKEQELALAEARQRAEEANTAKSRFIASMSHEVRTPLNGVLAMAAALERTPLTPDQAHMLEVMASSGRQLLAMLDDVLDVAKIEAGSLVLQNETFDLASSIEAVAALFREAARAKGLALGVKIAPNALGSWRGDALRVRQVLQNLVSNAVKFTARGAIIVRAQRVANGIRIEVEDTGIGIAQDQQARLFTPFMQADSPVTRRYGGTGLGLAICRELAELMGGSVGVRSTPDVGSLFWFEAPLARAEEAAPAPRLPRARILAAEDNPSNRAVLQTLLAQAGLVANFVEDGARAVEAARHARYDLVLMDLHMPEMDGVAAAHAIRAGGPNAMTPIVALTASDAPETLAACRAAGMAGRVPKPIAPAVLYAAIAAALDARRDGEALASRAAPG